MKTKFFSTAMLVMFGLVAFSQYPAPVENKSSVKFDWAGQVTFAKDVKTNVFLTFGGPSVKIAVDKIAVNFGMFPSLKYNYDYDTKTDKTPLAPILGTGVQVFLQKYNSRLFIFLNKK